MEQNRAGQSGRQNEYLQYLESIKAIDTLYFFAKKIIKNNLPKKSDNPIIHIRPHAKKSAYKLKSGYIVGNIERDANELPNGEYMTTQSFWINNTYILSQLKVK